MKKLIKLAESFEKRAEEFSTFREVANLASSLYNYLPDLEKGFTEEKDVFRTKRIVNTLHSVTKQTLIDGLAYGISAKAAQDYKNYLQMLTQWLMQMVQSQPYPKSEITTLVSRLGGAVSNLEVKPVAATMGPRATQTPKVQTPVEETEVPASVFHEEEILPPGLFPEEESWPVGQAEFTEESIYKIPAKFRTNTY